VETTAIFLRLKCGGAICLCKSYSEAGLETVQRGGINGSGERGSGEKECGLGSVTFLGPKGERKQKREVE